MTAPTSSMSDWGIAQWVVLAYVIVGVVVSLAIRCYLMPTIKRGLDGQVQWIFKRGDLLGRFMDMLDSYPVPFFFVFVFFWPIWLVIVLVLSVI